MRSIAAITKGRQLHGMSSAASCHKRETATNLCATLSNILVARMILEYLKVLISWPVVAVFLAVFFRASIRSLFDRIQEAKLPGGPSLVLRELTNAAKPKLSEGQSPDTTKSAPLELSVSPGAYSTERRAIFVVVGITNRGSVPDQITSWKLSFSSLALTLEPTAAPGNLLPTAPFWSDPLIRIQPVEFVRGTLFFRGEGVLQENIPEEPLQGRLTATTVNQLELSSDIRVYRMVTLQQHPELSS